MICIPTLISGTLDWVDQPNESTLPQLPTLLWKETPLALLLLHMSKGAGRKVRVSPYSSHFNEGSEDTAVHSSYSLVDLFFSLAQCAVF